MGLSRCPDALLTLSLFAILVVTASCGDFQDPASESPDDSGRSQAELAKLLGSRSRASEILARKRPLTTDMVHRISEAWRIPAELLVRPYACQKRKPRVA